MSDISDERVEEIARFHDLSVILFSDRREDSGLAAMHKTSAAMLRGLKEERQKLMGTLKTACAFHHEAVNHVEALTKERATLHDEIEKLKAALKECADDLEADIIRLLGGKEPDA